MDCSSISFLQASWLSEDAVALSPPRKIRQDLVNCVVDHFQDDFDTLRVIRLVGPQWLERSTPHLFRRGIILRCDVDCLNFAKCKPDFYPLVTSLRITYSDTSSGRRPSKMPNIFSALTRLERLTLNGGCTIKAISSDTLAGLGRLCDTSIGCLKTVKLEYLGRHVSPRRFPSFPSFLAAFKSGLQKLTIVSPTRFVAFEPESLNSLLNVEELELQWVLPGSWRHIAQFLDRRLKRLTIDIFTDQFYYRIPALLSLAPVRLDALQIQHFHNVPDPRVNLAIWGNYVLARDVQFSVTEMPGAADRLRVLLEWYIDCFVVAPAETFYMRFCIMKNSRSRLFAPSCDEMWKRWDETFFESKVLRSLTIELSCMFVRTEVDFCTQAIKDRLPRLSDAGKLIIDIDP